MRLDDTTASDDLVSLSLIVPGCEADDHARTLSGQAKGCGLISWPASSNHHDSVMVSAWPAIYEETLPCLHCPSSTATSNVSTEMSSASAASFTNAALRRLAVSAEAVRAPSLSQ